MHMAHEIDIATAEERLRIAGKTVAELCRKADIAQSTWCRWKSRSNSPRRITAKAIRQALDQIAPLKSAAP